MQPKCFDIICMYQIFTRRHLCAVSCSLFKQSLFRACTSLLCLLWLHICICLQLIQLGSHAVLTTCNHGFPTTIFLLPYHQVHLAVCTTRLRTRYVQMLWQVDTRQMLAAGVNHACVALHLRIADISSFTFHNNNCFFLFIGNFIWIKTLIDKLCHIVFKEFNLGLAISSKL